MQKQQLLAQPLPAVRCPAWHQDQSRHHVDQSLDRAPAFTFAFHDSAERWGEGSTRIAGKCSVYGVIYVLLYVVVVLL